MTSATGALLWCRAFLVGGVTMLLGTTAHVTGGGRVPGVLAMSALTVLVVVLSAPLLRVRAGWGRLAVLLGGGQLLLHAALTMLAGHRGDRGVRTSTWSVGESGDYAGETLGRMVDGRRVGSLYDAYAATQQSGQHSPARQLGYGDAWAGIAEHAPMMGVHVVVAAAIAGWLAYGERSLWIVLALVARRCLLLWKSSPLPLGRHGHTAPSPSVSVSVRLVVLAPCVVRRGPPDTLAA